MKRFLKVQGTPREAALQKGLAFHARFDEIIAGLLAAPFLPQTLKTFLPKNVFRFALKSIGKKYLRLHGPYLKTFHNRDLLEPLRGLAEGLNRDLSLVYGINAVEILSSRMSFSMGCTSLAFGSEQMADGNPRLAYNHDFPESFADFLHVEEERPAAGLATLTLTYPTLLGAIAGVNEKGLAVSLNHAFATDIHPKPAILITSLVKECLVHAANVEEALALAMSSEVPNGSMVSFVDATGHRAVVEFSAGLRNVRRADDGILYTFNCYRTNGMSQVEVPKTAIASGLTRVVMGKRLVHEHNIRRTERFLKLSQEEKKHDENEIRKWLGDHSDGNGRYDTICRHDANSMSTIASVVMNPRERKMKVIFGKACESLAEEEIYELN